MNVYLARVDCCVVNTYLSFRTSNTHFFHLFTIKSNFCIKPVSHASLISSEACIINIVVECSGIKYYMIFDLQNISLAPAEAKAAHIIKLAHPK